MASAATGIDRGRRVVIEVDAHVLIGHVSTREVWR